MRINKKHLGLFLILCLLLAVLPAAAMAAGPETLSAEARVIVGDSYALTGNSSGASGEVVVSAVKSPGNTSTTYYASPAAAGKAIRKYMTSHTENFSIPCKIPANGLTNKSDISRIKALFKAYIDSAIYTTAYAHTGNPFEGDYLRWTVDYWQWTGRYTYNASGACFQCTFSFNVGYRTTSAQEAMVQSASSSLLGSLLTSGMDEYQKTSAIFDYIIKNVGFDYYGTDITRYTAYAALINGKAVCQGYANLFYALCLKSGVDCRIITGLDLYDQGHAWNAVKVGTMYYLVDTTWAADEEDPVSYFLRGTNDYAFTASHRAEDEEPTPMAANNFSTAVPETPVLSVTRDDSGKPVVRWNACDDAQYYVLYRSVDGGSNKKIATLTGTSYKDTSAKVGTNCRYVVKAYGCLTTLTAKSNYASCKVTLDAPVIETSSVSSTGKIKISWSAVSGAKSYGIFRATSQNGTYTKIKTVTGTSYTDSTAKAGNTYYYKVKSYYTVSTGHSSYSNIEKRCCDLPAPKVTKIVLSSGKPQVSWKPVEDAISYEVYRSTDNKTFKKLGTVKADPEADGFMITDKTAEAGHVYYYKIKAVHRVSAAKSACSATAYIRSR